MPNTNAQGSKEGGKHNNAIFQKALIIKLIQLQKPFCRVILLIF